MEIYISRKSIEQWKFSAFHNYVLLFSVDKQKNFKEFNHRKFFLVLFFPHKGYPPQQIKNGTF